MKKSIYWLFLVVFALVLAVSAGAFRIIFIPAPSEEPLMGFCRWCQAECEYEVRYEKWTKTQHCVRHWCVECGYNQLAGCTAEGHDEVLDWCWKCGWPDSTNPYMKGDKILHNN